MDSITRHPIKLTKSDTQRVENWVFNVSVEDSPKLVIESHFMNEKTDFQRDYVFR